MKDIVKIVLVVIIIVMAYYIWVTREQHGNPPGSDDKSNAIQGVKQ